MLPGCIIVDFDYTLFDASAFKNALAVSLEKLGINKAAFWKTYSDIRELSEKMEYSPARHLNALASITGFDRKKAEENFNKIILNSRRYLYPDAVLFLENFSKLAPLLLLSRGNIDFQKRKVSACGIQKYFTEIELTEKDKNRCLKGLTRKYGDNIFFINDNIKETEDVAREFPNIKPILKRRDDVPNRDYLKEAIPNFNTLKEIKDYILSLYAK